MPPILLSPLVKWTLVAAGGAMVVHWVVNEVRRVNEELEARRRARAHPRPGAPADPAARSGERRIQAVSVQVL